jgi:hypothetical protein
MTARPDYQFEIALRSFTDEWQLHTFGTAACVRNTAKQLRSRYNKLGYKTRVRRAADA